MSASRRIFLFLLVVILAGYAWRRYESTRLPGVPEKYTPTQVAKLNLDDVQVLAKMDEEYTKLVEAVVPSVVSITSSREVLQAAPLTLEDALLGRRRAQRATSTSLGSGVIVSKEGHILTNHHVVAGMTEIRVQLTDGRNEPARLIGSDPSNDIAVLRIDAKNIEALKLGDSDKLRVGQMVFAVGNPFGLEESVSRGIVSAKGRRTGGDSGVEFIQTDAAVNQGNSGGPLVNIYGEVVGINTVIIASKTGGWQGISFSIPSNTARRVMEGIITRGRVVRGWLGVNLQMLTPQVAQALGLPDTRGARITEIMPGSPAELAQLQPNDVLREFNGQELENPMALRGLVSQVDIGETVEIVVMRDGKELRTTAKIAEMPEQLSINR